MKHRHTPGPWEITSHRPPYSEENDFPGVGISIPDAELASGIHEDAIEVWGENSEANARLIAAAPCLLAELQHAHQIILNAVAIMKPEQLSAWAQANERDGCDGDGATRYHERADVIAKATGSQP